MSLTALTNSQYKKNIASHRESNVELLRIITMCGVVLLHYNGGVGEALEYVKQGTLNKTYLLMLESLCIGAVDIFILITGYFSCLSQKRSAIKVAELLIQVSVFGAIEYLRKVERSVKFSVYSMISALLPTNYFVILYIVLFMVSPYINLAIKNLSEKQLKKMMVLCVSLFSIWTTMVDILEYLTGPKIGLSTISAYGGDYGYTIVNFILLYILGAGLRLLNIKIKKQYSFIIIVLCTVVITVFTQLDSSIARSYYNPIVILQAVMVFLFFRQINIKSNFINELSKATFTCYLFHPVVLEIVDVRWAVRQSIFIMLAHIICTCMGTYVVSFFVYKIWKCISNPIFIVLNRFFKKMELDFNVEE